MPQSTWNFQLGKSVVGSCLLFLFLSAFGLLLVFTSSSDARWPRDLINDALLEIRLWTSCRTRFMYTCLGTSKLLKSNWNSLKQINDWGTSAYSNFQLGGRSSCNSQYVTVSLSHPSSPAVTAFALIYEVTQNNFIITHLPTIISFIEQTFASYRINSKGRQQQQ